MFSIRFMRRTPSAAWAASVLFGGLLLGSSAGCTGFQTITTDKWFEGHWITAEPEQPINDILVTWEDHVRVTQNYMNGGAQLPGLAGRVYLLNEDLRGSVDARGTIVVQMVDMTHANKTTPPRRIAEWQFDPENLKSLKQKDMIGWGYTLYLPWESYREGQVKEIKVQVCYVPQKGVPRYTEPQTITLQSADAVQPMVTRRQEVPALLQRAERQEVRQAQQFQPMPVEQPQAAPAPTVIQLPGRN